MSLWSRIANVFRGDRLRREIDEELEAHIAEAIEQGRDPAEARRAFGSPLRQRERIFSTSRSSEPWRESGFGILRPRNTQTSGCLKG